MVELAHRQHMLVMGYFCAGSNTRWGQMHPDLSYGFPSEPHIPFTDEYLAYLDSAIRDAVKKTGIDGFMMDWLRMPTSRKSNHDHWLDCEKKLYAQLMGTAFPGETNITQVQMTEYGLAKPSIVVGKPFAKPPGKPILALSGLADLLRHQRSGHRQLPGAERDRLAAQRSGRLCAHRGRAENDRPAHAAYHLPCVVE